MYAESHKILMVPSRSGSFLRSFQCEIGSTVFYFIAFSRESITLQSRFRKAF